MALSGTVNSNSISSKSGSKTITTSLRLTWSATQSVANNTSTVTWKMVAVTNTGFNKGKGFSVTVNGSTSRNSATLDLRNGVQILNGTNTIAHSSNGTKSFSISIGGEIYNYGSQNAKGSGTFTLNTIPRESKITAMSRTAYSAKRIDINFQADKAFNAYRWARNGGGWNTVNVSSTTSAYLYQSGLSPATTYKYDIQVKNTSSGLWSSTRTANFSTAKLNTATLTGLSITPGNMNSNTDITATVTSELSGQRNYLDLYVVSSAGTDVWVGAWGQAAGGKRTLTITPAMKATIVNNTRSHTSRTLKLRVTSFWSGANEGNVWSGTSTVTIGSGPSTIGSFSYSDVNSTVTGVTGNNKYIVSGLSTFRAVVGTPRDWRGEWPARVTVTFGGKEVGTTSLSNTTTLDISAPSMSGTSTNAIIRVYNTRGGMTEFSRAVNTLPYSAPYAPTFNPERLNQYEEESWVRGVTKTSALAIGSTNKNTISLSYRMKQNPSGAWGAWQSITSPTTSSSGQTLTTTINQYMSKYPNTNEYTLELRMIDKFRTTYATGILRAGTALLRFKSHIIEAGVPLDAEWHVKDARSTNPTPDQLPGATVSTFFNNQYGSTWQSGFSVKGWTAGYTAWQLSSHSSNTEVVGEGRLRFRSGRGASWGPWQNVWAGATLIPSNRNLNSYMEEGLYYNPSNASVETLSNYPPITRYAFSLMVEKHAGVRQTLSIYLTTGTSSYVRNYYNGSWGSWGVQGLGGTINSSNVVSGTTVKLGANTLTADAVRPHIPAPPAQPKWKVGYADITPGTTTVTSGGVTWYQGSMRVNFGMTFSKQAKVTIGINTGAPYAVHCGVTEVDKTGFTLTISRINRNSTGVNWFASDNY